MRDCHLAHGLPWFCPPTAAIVRFARLPALMLALLLSRSLPAAENVSVREVRVQARNALAAGAYEEAITLLKQLIEWFAESKEASTQMQMEFCQYNVGLCHYLLGHFVESEKEFQTYLKKFPKGPHVSEARIYSADGYRYQSKTKEAVAAYKKILDEGGLSADWETDVLCSLVRCYLVDDDWQGAIPFMKRAYVVAPDDTRANWAATLLTVAFMKELKVEEVYKLVPYLLRPNSVASRSVAFNLSGLEAADGLFADERYRDSLWIYRLIHPRDQIQKRAERFLKELQQDLEDMKENPQGRHRDMLRTQEMIGDLEEELKLLDNVENYDIELKSRTARAYMEIRRYWEARALFLYLYEACDDKKQIEDSLYFAFHCSTQLKPWDRALELGQKYMDEFPAGTYYDIVSLTVGQLHAVQKDWPNVIATLTKALEISPQHQSAAECMFLIGYASFMLEKFGDTVTWLTKMNTQHPGNERAMEGTYWTGMAYMFDKKYQPAVETFESFLKDFPDSPYIEDATFRRNTCVYGLSQFEQAEKLLTDFTVAFPNSRLLGEAFMMLADIAGTYGDLKKCVEYYKQALEHDLNIELYNYCAFRCGEMLNDLNDFPNLVRHFEAYVEQEREGANIPLATYWIAKGLWQMDQPQAAMQYLLKAVKKYGTDRTALGVDLILDEWIGRAKKLDPTVADEAWGYLHAVTADARKEGQRALALRLERTFLYRPGITDKAKELLVADLLKEDNLPVAPIGVLEFMMDESKTRGNMDLAVKAAEAVIKDFPETDTVMTARMLMAEQAMANKDYDTAELHLNIIRETFATSMEAANALMLLGEICKQKRKYDEADKFYKDILGVKEWRGPLWPQALYERGECARFQRKFHEACAYYERIYLMYANYRDWCAKAYMQRANCLVALQEREKARQTLEEMLSIKELAEGKEGTEAREMLKKIQGTSL